MTDPAPPRRPRRRSADTGRDRVALVLSVGVGSALLCITIGVLWDAIVSAGPGLSENATQVISGAFGGIIGVLGSYLGFRAGAASAASQDPAADRE